MSFYSFLYRMPSGMAGTISRDPNAATVEPQPLDAGATFSAYGMAGVIDSSTQTFRPVQSGDTAVSGFLVRPFPTQAAPAAQYAFGTDVPPTSGIGDVLKRGYISVVLAAGTAALNGTVYVRTAVGSSGKSIGDIEAGVSDPSNCIAVTNAYFTGPADASGNAEVAFHI